MSLVGYQAQLTRAAEDATRLTRKGEVIALERRRAEEERSALEARYAEAQESIGRLQDEQRLADERLGEAQRRLMQARGTVDELSAKAAEALATHAGLLERAAALAAEVQRLEEGARELEERIGARTTERQQTETR